MVRRPTQTSFILQFVICFRKFRRKMMFSADCYVLLCECASYDPDDVRERFLTPASALLQCQQPESPGLPECVLCRGPADKSTGSDEVEESAQQPWARISSPTTHSTASSLVVNLAARAGGIGPHAASRRRGVVFENRHLCRD